MAKKLSKKEKNYKPEPEILSVFYSDTTLISKRASIAIRRILLIMAREVFSNETMESILEYGNVLRDIHDRVISEGNYVWENGKFNKKAG